MASTGEVVSIVEKLKKRLNEVLSDGSSKQEEDIVKILKKLSLVSMSIDILKTTQIGKQVNNLRKWGGKVSSKAKSLVKKWKQLLPDTEESHHQESTHNSSIEDGTGSRIELRHGEGEELSSLQSLKRKTKRHVSRESVPVIHIESGEEEEEEEEEEDSRMYLTDEVSNSKKRHHHQHQHQQQGRETKKKITHKISYEDEFSRALAMPLEVKKVPRGRSRDTVGTHQDGSHAFGKERSPIRTEILRGNGERSSRQEPVSVVMKERSPGVVALGDSCSSAGLKRKVPSAEPEVAIGHSKRSRTQVYSGRKALSGPQVVTSLFDTCMKVLIDNIDVIEEVGPGVPYHVLEPLLLRCTASQLMKLEEFNPHLMEDTDDLWRKHILRDFKETRNKTGYTWRELYGERLAEREEKLRRLTARIKANKDAREEPVRKVKLAEATMKPGRRSASRRGGGGFSGGFFPPMERPHPQGSQLMKRTMKMAKERNHMMSFKSRK